MLYNFLSRYGQFIALAIGAFITIVFFAIIGANQSTLSDLQSQGLSRTGYNDALSATSIFDFGLYGTAFLIFACVLAALALGIWGIVKHPEAAVKPLIGVAIIIVLFIIGYSIANPSDVQEVIEKINKGTFAEDGSPTLNTVTEAKSKFVSGGITSVLVLGAVSFLGLLGFEGWNLFR